MHDPGDMVATAAVSLFAEFHQNAWTPIRLPAPGMDGLNFLGQRLICHGAWAGRCAAALPVVITAGRDFGLALKARIERWGHLVSCL